MPSPSRHLVDPQLLPLLETFPPLELSTELLPLIRCMPPRRAASAANIREQVDLESHTIAGPPGAPEVSVFVYTPRAKRAPLPCILHIHGGGYVMGSASGMEAVHRPLALDAACVVASVEYRLAPETRFPGAVEDCYAALRWLHAHARELGIDPRRIGALGESAGGGLTAALALLARDRREHPLAFQHLIYPMIDDRTCTAPDLSPYVGEFVWSPANNAFGWSSLLGAAPGSADVSPYAAAARATELHGLPPTYLSTGALDLFLEEDLEYARRLMRHGVPVELHVYPGAFHAFELAEEAQVARQARRDSLLALKRALHG